MVSPGSRNAPLIVALARSGRYRLTTVIDERSAAFAALGMSEATGTPVAIVCTSGSAMLNYAPALAEAYYSPALKKGTGISVESALGPDYGDFAAEALLVAQLAGFGEGYGERHVDVHRPGNIAGGCGEGSGAHSRRPAFRQHEALSARTRP